MAAPSMIGVIDTYGIELVHPRWEGRSKKQIGRKGKSNCRWIVGGKLGLLLNHIGLVVGWGCDTANVYDGSAFQHLVERVVDGMVVFADDGFAKKGWHPANLKLSSRRVECADDDRDCPVDVDSGLSSQKGDSSSLGVFQESCRLHNGSIQLACAEFSL